MWLWQLIRITHHFPRRLVVGITEPMVNICLVFSHQETRTEDSYLRSSSMWILLFQSSEQFKGLRTRIWGRSSERWVHKHKRINNVIAKQMWYGAPFNENLRKWTLLEASLHEDVGTSNLIGFEYHSKVFKMKESIEAIKPSILHLHRRNTKVLGNN